MKHEEYSHSTLCYVSCLCPSLKDKYIEERAYAFFLFLFNFFKSFVVVVVVGHVKVFH